MQTDKYLYVVSILTTFNRREGEVIRVGIHDRCNPDIENIKYTNSIGITANSCTSLFKDTTRIASREDVLNSSFKEEFLEWERNQGGNIVSVEIKKFNIYIIEDMEVVKSKEVLIKGQKRNVTVAVVVAGGKVRTGYSVCMPDDKFSKDLGAKIAKGRAMSDKTNLTPDMVMGVGMDKKYILYAIADNTIGKLERGVIEVKGIKDVKVEEKKPHIERSQEDNC